MPNLDDSNKEYCIKLNDSEIEEVKQTKFLGVIIDKTLSWIPHIEYLARKLKSCVGTINRIKTNLPPSLYKSIYHTLFESHMSYGITVWGGASKKYMDKLFVIQKNALEYFLEIMICIQINLKHVHEQGYWKIRF